MSGLPGPTLRIAVLGEFESSHTRRWVRVFVERGHDVHAISYYAPRVEVPGATLHVLSGQAAPSAGGPVNYGRLAARLRRYAPHAVLRFAYGLRYLRAGLKERLRRLQPDVFHGHFAVEHGFYGALAGYRPYVVSAWGSDLFVESYKPLSRRIAAWTLAHADFVTVADPAMEMRARALGVSPRRMAIVRLGVDPLFLAQPPQSVNLEAADTTPPTILSYRALEPLYNVDVVLRAFARLRQSVPEARLLVAGDGSERQRLERLAGQLGEQRNVTFLGQQTAEQIKALLQGAQVYVSVPTTDSLAVSTMEAMASGCFPVVSDLPSQDGWLWHRVNALRVPPGDVEMLADAFYEALLDPALRRAAAIRNRSVVEAEGVLEKNMLLMERHYYRLAGIPGPD